MKKQFHKLFFAALLMLSMSLISTEAYSQCAMCRATVESNVGTGSTDSDSQVGAGLNTGILYLMLIPYVLVGTIGFLWYRSSKRKSAKVV